jgi:hypothetical protein
MRTAHVAALYISSSACACNDVDVPRSRSRVRLYFCVVFQIGQNGADVSADSIEGTYAFCTCRIARVRALAGWRERR